MQTQRSHFCGRLMGLLVSLALGINTGTARTIEIHSATVEADEEFEKLANALQPGDELVLHGGTYSQNSRRAVTAKGTAGQPIIIRAAAGDAPLLTRHGDQRDKQNNIEFVDCAHLVIRGLRFQGGS